MTTKKTRGTKTKPVADQAAGREVMAHDAETERNRGDKWVGQWFAAEIGVNYYVPGNAGNHAEARGKSGTCTAAWQTGFGHSWAIIETKDGERLPVRTCYLKPVDDDTSKLDLVEPPPTQEHLQMFGRCFGNDFLESGKPVDGVLRGV